VYVYRDTGGHPGEVGGDSSAHDPAERTAAYWYDPVAEDLAPKLVESRGPFEPLVPSSGPPPDAAGQPSAAQDTADPAGTRRGQGPAGAVPDEGADEMAHARARKLEQIKDFYLTAEAIGEQNLDKHFDQLLARQRELISEYFRQSATAQPSVAGPRDGLAAEAAAEPRDPNRPGITHGQAGPPEGAGVVADPPRAW
jgi:hypothetical protein